MKFDRGFHNARLGRKLAIVATACFGISGLAQGASISIANAGFEDIILADGGFNVAVSQWTVTDGGTWNPTIAEYPGEAPEGQNVAFLGSVSGATTGVLQQTLATTFAAGLQYTLSALIGDRLDMTLPTFRIGLWADGVLVSTGGLVTAQSDPRIPADGGFGTVTASVVADAAIAGKAIEIKLEAFLADPPLVLDLDPVAQISFDNIQLSSAVVPLPPALLLFGSALAMLLRRRGRGVRNGR
ncbi:MAG: hypothetical protein ACE5G3_08720 [Gammaproteobacteria bacterium]